MKSKKKVIFLAVLVIFLAAFYVVQKSINESDNLTLYGNVDIRDVSLGFEVQGKLVELNYEEGDRVSKGDILASLDKEIFEKQLALSAAQLDQARASLDNSALEYDRQKRLLNQKVSSQKNYDDAQTQYKQAVSGVIVAQAKYDLDEITLKHSKLLAPDEGVIITRAKEIGSIVNPSIPIYVLALDKPVWVRTYIEEPHLGNIYPGQIVEVLTDSRKKYSGQIGFISPQAEFTPNTVQTTELRTSLVYRLRVIIDNPDQSLRQGMPVTINIKKK
jgi:HlyD family secretion protein